MAEKSSLRRNFLLIYGNYFCYSEESNQWPECSVGRKMARPVQLHYHTKESHQVRAHQVIRSYILIISAFLSTSSADRLLMIAFQLSSICKPGTGNLLTG